MKDKHINELEQLARTCGNTSITGTALYGRLRSFERRAERLATDYCNGDVDSDKWDQESARIEKRVQSLFNGKLEGFIINGDPRGYALKLKEGSHELSYTDWGRYQILAPDFEESN